MTGTFALLTFIALVLMVWSLAKPQHFSKYSRGKQPTRKHLGLGFGIVAFVFFILVGITAPKQTPASTTVHLTSTTAQQTPAKPKNTVTTKQVTTTQPIAFTTTTENDASLTKGESKVVQTGQNGVTTFIYTVTYTNGKETNRVLTSQATTTQPTPQIVEEGTYVAPVEHPETPTDCTNGTYVNSSGNTVCNPETAPSAPAGATAQCKDGTYSFSQHHSGTCSDHGGVAEWL